MKFSVFDKDNKKIEKGKRDEWVKYYDFNVCHLISEARLKSGLTQKQLADLVGTKQPSIARAENGSVLPGHNLLKKIALAIGTSLIPPRFGFTVTPNSQTIIITKVEERVKLYPIFVGSTNTYTDKILTANQTII